MILAIDFGRSHLGLAISDGSLAAPFATLKNDGQGRYRAELGRLVKELGVTTLVVGLSEGAMADQTRRWSENLAKMLQLPLEFTDETLSSVEAGRTVHSHARAAAIILQRYLDSKIKS